MSSGRRQSIGLIPSSPLASDLAKGVCQVEQLAGPGALARSCMMNKIICRGYRFPPEIIQRAIWLYYRFTLSLRDVEELLAERGIEVTYETIRQWGRL